MLVLCLLVVSITPLLVSMVLQRTPTWSGSVASNDEQGRAGTVTFGSPSVYESPTNVPLPRNETGAQGVPQCIPGIYVTPTDSGPATQTYVTPGEVPLSEVDSFIQYGRKRHLHFGDAVATLRFERYVAQEGSEEANVDGVGQLLVELEGNTHGHNVGANDGTHADNDTRSCARYTTVVRNLICLH